MASSYLWCLGQFFLLCLQQSSAAFNYADALTKSILYFEAQRSGKLPANQRVQWRADSALRDGIDGHVNLVGGYYDAGDNVKFGFTMAFTVTLLAWSAVEFEKELAAKNELSHTLDAIKWGTDYFIDAHPQPDVLYGEVGDGDSDHACWQRPEDMNTPRTSYRIDQSRPGSDLAGETAAALAAASIAFAHSNPSYSATLLTHAKQLFNFASSHRGVYSNSIPVAREFYSSSGFDDELSWAAAWLHRATNSHVYLNYLVNAGDIGGTRSEFSWDDKFVGAQTLVAKLVLEGKVANNGIWAQYKNSADQFICSCIQKGSNNVRMTPGGLLNWHPWNPLQYTTSAMLVMSAYYNYLTATRSTLQCPAGLVQPAELLAFTVSQVDYILGANPKGMSYMVGFGSNYPSQVHHRGASIVSIKKDGDHVSCQDGFTEWFDKNSSNPNVLVGAVVGGPDITDEYSDSRSNYQQAEPTTVTTAAFVGVLAHVA